MRKFAIAICLKIKCNARYMVSNFMFRMTITFILIYLLKFSKKREFY